MSTPAATLVIHNISELATCDAARGVTPGVLTHAALAASGRLITFVGSETELHSLERGPDCMEIDAGGCAVVPGFVDSHSHLVWLGERSYEYELRAQGASYEDIAAAGGGIRSTVTATQSGAVSDLVEGAHDRASAMLRLGTTTVEVKSGYGLTLAAELRELEAIRELHLLADVPDLVATYLPMHATPPNERGEFLREVNDEGLRQVRGLAEFVDAFCDTGAYSVVECEAFLTTAATMGFGLKLHAEQRSHTGAAQLAARLGAVSADHLEFANDADLAALARAGTVAVLLPGAALTLGGPPPPGRRALDAGATVAIATDCNPGTCYTESMPLIMSLAVALAGLTAGEALCAATRGGAQALRQRDRGVIRVGRRCDLVITGSAHWLDLCYHLGGDVVAQVVREGVVVA